MAIERRAHRDPRRERSEAPRASDARMRLSASLSETAFAIALVDLSTMTVEAISKAGTAALGRPVDQIIGVRVVDLLDPVDRAPAEAALRALASGTIELYRAYRHGVARAKPRTGYCAWARRVDLDGKPHAFIRWVEPREAPGTWPSAAVVFSEAIAVALTDQGGVARTATVLPIVGDDFSADDIVGTRVLRASQVDNLVTLDDWRAARIRGVSIAYPAAIRNRHGEIVELEALATAWAGAAGWLVVFLRMDPPVTRREIELEAHLQRIAAELEASGVMQRARLVPGLSIARIPEAASLSPRQWEVLRRIMDGQRVPVIAKELFVSPSTVRNHLSAIFRAFGVHSQPELLAHLAETSAPSS